MLTKVFFILNNSFNLCWYRKKFPSVKENRTFFRREEDSILAYTFGFIIRSCSRCSLTENLICLVRDSVVYLLTFVQLLTTSDVFIQQKLNFNCQLHQQICLLIIDWSCKRQIKFNLYWTHFGDRSLMTCWFKMYFNIVSITKPNKFPHKVAPLKISSHSV